MERTLFGWSESKEEARARAAELFSLHAAVADTPNLLDCRTGQVGQFDYFIGKAERIQLDCNDKDGLQRFVQCLSEAAELTEEDCRWMWNQVRFWKPTPEGFEWWCGCRRMVKKKTQPMYCATLHPKEIATLKEMRAELVEEIESIKLNLPKIQARIGKLKDVGPLPEAIAEKHRLTVDGDPKPKEAKAA